MLLQTERCIVRRYTPQDTAELYLLLSDEAVMKYIEPVYSMEKTCTFLKEAGLCEPPLVYALVWKQTGSLIGQIIFHRYQTDSYEIGWLLRPAYWGMGLACEVTEELMAYAKRIGAASCVLECHPEQMATRHIALKYRFLPEEARDALCLYRWKCRE